MANKKRKKKKPGRPKGTKGYRLSKEHIDYICDKVARWQAANLYDLVDDCMKRFPEHAKTVKNRHEWWRKHISRHFKIDDRSNPKPDTKYYDKIIFMREEYKKAVKDEIPLANSINRVKKLVEIVESSLSGNEKITQKMEYAGTPKEKKTIQKVKFSRDYYNATRALEQIRVEVGDEVTEERFKLNVNVYENSKPIKYEVNDGTKKEERTE